MAYVAPDSNMQVWDQGYNPPGMGGGGQGRGSGGMEHFMQLLAQSRADKARREGEERVMRERQMAAREEQAEYGRGMGERGMAMDERSQALSGMLQQQESQARQAQSEQALKVGEAQHAARQRFMPKSIIAGRPGVIGGVVNDPSQANQGYMRDVFGAQESGFTEAGSDAPGGQAWRDDQERRDRRNAFARPLLHPGGSGYGGDKGSFGYVPPKQG